MIFKKYIDKVIFVSISILSIIEKWSKIKCLVFNNDQMREKVKCN